MVPDRSPARYARAGMRVQPAALARAVRHTANQNSRNWLASQCLSCVIQRSSGNHPAVKLVPGLCAIITPSTRTTHPVKEYFNDLYQTPAATPLAALPERVASLAATPGPNRRRVIPALAGGPRPGPITPRVGAGIEPGNRASPGQSLHIQAETRQKKCLDGLLAGGDLGAVRQRELAPEVLPVTQPAEASRNLPVRPAGVIFAICQQHEHAVAPGGDRIQRCRGRLCSTTQAPVSCNQRYDSVDFYVPSKLNPQRRPGSSCSVCLLRAAACAVSSAVRPLP